MASMQAYGATRNRETIMCKWNHCGGKFCWATRKTTRGRAVTKARRKTARQAARRICES